MPSPRLALLAALLALACAAPASAGVEVVTRDVPLAGSGSARATASGGRVLAARLAPARFNLLGLHWRGSGDVWFRTARVGGAWSPWRPARPETEDGPNRGSREARSRAGWKLGNPYWTGTARRLQLRLSGRVTRVRAHYLWSPVRAAPLTARTTAAAPTKPPLVSRAAWGANEKIVRGSPSFASRLAFAVVHHTAGARPSSAAQSAAIVRGIHSYHVLSNGWNDIGYNFLVDPFGQIFVGRKGGAKRNVIGAHAQGFNTGSVGVAVLGTYGTASISTKAREALTALLAWRLDLAHVDPTSRLTWTSGGNPKFPAGTPVSLAAVSGHRDTGATSCPGTRLHKALGSLASAIRARGGPKIFAPRASGSLGGPVRFTGRLSTALAWTAQVRDAAGAVVASGSGTGTAVDWTWDSAAAPPGRYTYRIAAGTARAATGVIGGSAPPLALTALTARPLVATPNGDGVGDRQKVTVTVTRSALLDVRLETPEGAPVATVVAARALGPGTTTVSWKGKAADGTRVEDGRYVLVAEASAGVERAARELPVRVDRTLARLTVTRTPFSPNGDRRRDTVAVSWELRRAATVRARVVGGGRVVASLRSAALAAGRTVVRWNGRSAGTVVADGRLSVVVDATTSLGTRRLKRKLVLDTTPPRARILAARRVRGGTLLRLALSERAKIAVRLGGRTVRLTARKGTNELRLPIRTAALTVYSFDLAGNAGRRVSKRVT